MPVPNLSNPEGITLSGTYDVATLPIVFPARVPVMGFGSTLRVGAGGLVHFPEAVKSIWGLSVNGGAVNKDALLRIGTGPDNATPKGKGAKAHFLDLDVSEPGAIANDATGKPLAFGAVEVRNLQNSLFTNPRLDNVLKRCNGFAFIHGCKGVTLRNFWSTNCKDYSLLIDTILGDQQTSKITIDGGMAEMSPVAIAIGDAELTVIRDFVMNTSVGIHIRTAAGTRTYAQSSDKFGQTVPETARRCSRLSIQGLRGATGLFLKSDYQVDVIDYGGHDSNFYTQLAKPGGFPNVNLVKPAPNLQ